ncbi:MAG TPA: c-type cytochrome [Actinomycetes bacterium]|nr:c-type cytochrome [Actinomycetes bacterium]
MRRTAILLAGIALLALLLAPATRAAGGATAAQAGGDASLQTRGRQLYQQACAACHGPDPNGAAAYATVPSLKDVGGAAAVDWALRTGRMPWRSTVGPAIARANPRFGEQDIRALTVYIGRAVGDAQLPDVDPARGDLTRGRDLYGTACSACHGMNGAGSALGGQNIAPSLQNVEPIDVAEAIKIGPGEMPVGGGLASYDPHSADSQRQVDDIAAYVQSLRSNRYDRGGAPIGGKGPVPEGFVAWVIGLGVLIVASRWIAGGGEGQQPSRRGAGEGE